MSDRTGLDGSDEAVSLDLDAIEAGHTACSGSNHRCAKCGEWEPCETFRLVAAVRTLRAENGRLQPEIVCMSCERLTANVDCVCDGCILGDQAEEIDRLRAVLAKHAEAPSDKTLTKLHDRAHQQPKSRAWRVVDWLVHNLDNARTERDSLAARLAEVEAEREAARETIERLSHWPRQTAALAVAEAQLAAVRAVVDDMAGYRQVGRTAPWTARFRAALAAVPGLLETHSKEDLSSSGTDDGIDYAVDVERSAPSSLPVSVTQPDPYEGLMKPPCGHAPPSPVTQQEER